MTIHEESMILACVDKLEYIYRQMPEGVLDSLLEIEIKDLNKLMLLRKI